MGDTDRFARAVAVKVPAVGAEIEVHNTMIISGRGAVLIGYVVSGAARAGQLTAALALGDAPARRLEVSAVERLSSLERRAPAVALIFVNPPRLEDLRRRLPPGSVLVLEDPDAAV